MALFFDLESKSAYDDSITRLRTYLSTHRIGTVDITVSAYEGGETVDFRMRCDKLYLDGFQKTGSGKWYHFKDATGWSGSTALPFGGAHRDLGTDQTTTVFTSGSKFKLDELVHYSGSDAQKKKLALCFYVVAISEAARFAPIQERISTLISLSGIGPSDGAEVTYCPRNDHATYMKKWDNLTQAKSGDVVVPFK